MCFLCKNECKCHNKTLCTAILYKQNCLFLKFFFYKIKEQESIIGPIWGIHANGWEEGIRVQEGEYGGSIEIGKMRPVVIIPGE
jgi:hypothetical protein